ncbi:MAG: hypothetical protein V4757_23380 [Pseudomonadota bacterium]
MKYFTGLTLSLAALACQAQSYCASDGQPAPAALVERFINADCASCWGDVRTPKPGRGELALDWIVPVARGDEAVLSAAASRDSLARLETLRRQIPASADTLTTRSRPAGQRLRVSHGLPFNGYLGTSIELKPARGGPWNAWLLLVETIPAGSEGTPVERNLVRNALQVEWDARQPGTKELYEARPMAIPEGARPERLRVVGWVESADGLLAAIAASRCKPERKQP